MENKFEWGLFNVYIDSKKGKIEQIKIYSDILYPIFVDVLHKHLINIPYTPKGIQEGMKKVKFELQDDQQLVQFADEFESWLIKNL